jgi:hypothetical protein
MQYGEIKTDAFPYKMKMFYNDFNRAFDSCKVEFVVKNIDKRQVSVTKVYYPKNMVKYGILKLLNGKLIFASTDTKLPLF